jgi:HSP20 family molecular chaperone IbpA
MPQMPVKILCSRREVLDHLAQLMKGVHNDVRERAFHRFREHGCWEGRELEDWAEAQREVLYSPPSTVSEGERLIHIHAAAPGFEASTLQVNVLPQSITIEGCMEQADRHPDEKVHFSELGKKRLLRQFDLPARIEPEQVKAILENGVLHIIARKAAAPGLEAVKLVKRTAA